MSAIDIRRERDDAREALAQIHELLLGTRPSFWLEPDDIVTACVAAVSRLKQAAAGQRELWTGGDE